MPVPDFSPGEVLTAAAMDSIGLWLVKTQTIGSGVSTVAVTGAFSADYDNYRISINTVGSTNMWVTLQFGSTTTGYYGGHDGVAYTNKANFDEVIYGNANGVSGSVDVFNPFTARNTVVSSFSPLILTGGNMGIFGGFVNDTTSYTGFTIANSGGTFTGGTIRVYGYRN